MILGKLILAVMGTGLWTGLIASEGFAGSSASTRIAESVIHKERQMGSIEIALPGAVIAQVQDRQLIQAAFLELLSQLAGRHRLPLSGNVRIAYNPIDEPEKRSETWGDRAYGLEMQADPIASGYGVHGERGWWEFHGLPAGVDLRGEHLLDLRGGKGNYLALAYSCETPEQETLIRDSFAREIRALLKP